MWLLAWLLACGDAGRADDSAVESVVDAGGDWYTVVGPPRSRLEVEWERWHLDGRSWEREGVEATLWTEDPNAGEGDIFDPRDGEGDCGVVRYTHLWKVEADLAGTLRLAGEGGQADVEAGELNAYELEVSGIVSPGATVEVSLSGGTFPALPATPLTIPPSLVLLSPSLDQDLPRGDVVFSWEPGDGEPLQLFISAFLPDKGSVTQVQCRVPDTGSFTVAAALRDQLPTSLGDGYVAAVRVYQEDVSVGDTTLTLFGTVSDFGWLGVE